MFVAFTGYGRIATLGEEVRDPRHVIPRAIAVTVTVVTRQRSGQPLLWKRWRKRSGALGSAGC